MSSKESQWKGRDRNRSKAEEFRRKQEFAAMIKKYRGYSPPQELEAVPEKKKRHFSDNLITASAVFAGISVFLVLVGLILSWPE